MDKKRRFSSVEEYMVEIQNRKILKPYRPDPAVWVALNDHYASLEFKQANLPETDHLEYVILTPDNMHVLVKLSMSFNPEPTPIISNRNWSQISFTTTNCGANYHFFEYAWIFNYKKTKKCIGFVSMYDMISGHGAQICKSCSIGLYAFDTPKNRKYLEEAFLNLRNQVDKFYKVSIVNVETIKSPHFIQELLLKHNFSQIDDYRNPSANFYRLNLDCDHEILKGLFEQNYPQLKNKYSYIGKLSEGLIRVAIGDKINERKYGFIHCDGTEVIPTIYSGVNDFHEGLAAAKIEHVSNGKWGFINAKGEQVIPFLFEQPRYFSDGFAKVKYKSEWCFVDKKGEKLILLTDFQEVGSFHHGYALVKTRKQDTLYGLINKNGALVVPFVHHNNYTVWNSLKSDSNSLVDENRIIYLDNKNTTTVASIQNLR